MKQEATKAQVAKRLEEMATSIEVEVDRNITLDHLLAVVKHEYLRVHCPPCGRNSLVLRFRDPMTEVKALSGVIQAREIFHGPTPEPSSPRSDPQPEPIIRGKG